MFHPGFHNIPYCIGYFRPERGIIGDKRNGQPREHRFRPGIGDFSAHPDRYAVVFGIHDLDGRADYGAVAAHHAFFRVDFHALELGIGTDGAGGAGSDNVRDFAYFGSQLMVDAGNHAMDADNRDVRAMAGAAHVDTAGHCDTATGRYGFLSGKVIAHGVHDVLG